MKKFYLLIVVIIAVLAVAGVYYAIKNWQPVPPSEKPLITEDIITRKEVITDVSKKIGEISPVKPVLGGNWYVTRFWFIKDSNKDFYVEYEDGHIMRQILVEAKKNGELSYKIIGVFEPGEVGWELKQGEDEFFGTLLDLYEYNEELREWIKKN